ncbi:MAG: RNA-binding transcriptional accessory protein [Firmicutes bacterium]|uniref:RNA-binding transcriptional accessory protein n=1 Tax=Candidatus Onthovivens merdipullorum TaxID=2840889 RepID=A0A9D9DHR4_9BACL|nr:RNA-binding transcriptional accessory protein [Candidatus Onthovivens merdipullorum]
MDIIKIISSELDVSEVSVSNAIKLIDEGNTIPFIARYRKEITHNMSDTTLRKLEERLIYLRKLEERIETVINSILEQGKLTDELKNSIENVKTLSELEDLYRPYKPKKKTRASIAKEKGLEPLAKILKEGKINVYEEASKFINPDKKVNSVEEAISGAKDIVSEDISDEAIYRKFIKKYIQKYASIKSSEIKKDEKDTYGKYADYSEQISSIPPHRILAINRGEKEKCLKVSLSYEKDEIFDYIGKKENINNNKNKELMIEVIEDSLKRLILPSVENEIRSDLFTFAEDESIEIFKKNLYQLLMYPPIKNIYVLGFDPGFRTGCKYAYVDSFGKPLKIGQVYITSNDSKKVDEGIKEITRLLKENRVDYIALGNGTASRESETVLSKIIKDNNFKTKIFIVNESGASVYSASKLGEEEFPNLPVEKRSAISLARRLQDPLAELVKIDPKAIGVGQYQHDMDQNKLDFALTNTVIDVVNLVGVNVNFASISLLKYVSGINKTLAKNIFDYRNENGPFKNREELKKVPKMGAKAFEQCAGFLRIFDGDEPLDNTGIHPESYEFTKKILEICKVSLKNDDLSTISKKLENFDEKQFLKENSIGKDTLEDILKELVKPHRDIREEAKIIELNNDVKDIKDLKVGMILNGTVRNVMDFGIFVDINVHQDGLVHISELSKKFIKHPSELFAINDIVKVKVIGVDVDKKRISLSVKQV